MTEKEFIHAHTKDNKLWCPFFKPCGLIGFITCKFTEMYPCEYSGDLNKCNMKRAVLEEVTK